jgi:cytochrome c-type biogenesis protein
MIGGVEHLVASGPLILAVPVALAAGAVTFLSPCCLPLVPGYLSYVTGMSGADASGAGSGGPAVAGLDSDGPDPGGPDSAGPDPGGPDPGGPDPGGPDPAGPDAGGPVAGGPVAGRTVRAGQAAGSPGAGTPAAGSVATATRATVGQAPGRSRVMAGAALFVLGFAALFTSYGAAFGGIGERLLAHEQGVTRILGGVTIVLGLMFAGVFDRFTLTGRIVRPSWRPGAGLAGAPLLGVMFGLTWTPCIGPTLSVVLLMAGTAGTAARGALLAFCYGIGIGIPFLMVAFAFRRGMNVFGFARRHGRLITATGGMMLVAVGLLEVSGTWGTAMTWLKIHWIGNYQSPL